MGRGTSNRGARSQLRPSIIAVRCALQAGVPRSTDGANGDQACAWPSRCGPTGAPLSDQNENRVQNGTSVHFASQAAVGPRWWGAASFGVSLRVATAELGCRFL
jgi:hypothetical protein